MPAKKPQQKKTPVRRPTMPRVTNNDLQASLIRMEEAMKPLAEAAARVPTLQEAQIRTEGSLKDHDSKLNVLFEKTAASVKTLESVQQKDLPAITTKVESHISADRAVMGVLAAVVGIVLTVVGYFVSQQSDTMHSIADSTAKTAAAVTGLDKRLSITEYQLARIQTAPATASGSDSK